MVQFVNDDHYLIVPLASFAADQNSNTQVFGAYAPDTQVCSIYTQMLDASQIGNSAIVFGSMFFQNVYLNMTTVQNSFSSTTTASLSVNVNAMSMTTISNTPLQPWVGPTFNITPTDASPNMTASMNGLPEFTVDIQHLDKGSALFMDFANSNTLVFSKDCIQYVYLPAGPCNQYPTLVIDSYDNQNTDYQTFSMMQFGGYIVSGKVFTT